MANVIDIADSIRYVVARAAQETTSALVTSTPTPSSTIPPPQSTTSPAPSTSSSASGGGGGGGGSSSPLLFFVALGFGVVFTNLWIIVGVKYCFRYNARNRALRNAEGIDPITLDNMPARPHRRRREKKLMTMDEVNERFPLSKYKNWVATRASEGLSTAGGVSGTAPPSRAPSVKDAEGIAPVARDDKAEATSTAKAAVTEEGEAADKRKSTETSTVEKEPTSPYAEHFGLKEVQTSESANREGDEEDDDDDEHIHTALPPELLANPGDSCAICIDVLEQDDDVRGLTCGHAFHAGCLDPWLTSRRACCPLCKADYYVPKPRPEGEAAAETERSSRRTRAPQPPPTVWTGLRPSRMGIPGRFIIAGHPGDGVGYGARESRQEQRARRATAAAAAAEVNNVSTTATQGGPTVPAAAATTGPSRWRSRISNPFRSITIPGRNRTATATDAAASEATEPSPSQLEAGVTR